MRCSLSFSARLYRGRAARSNISFERAPDSGLEIHSSGLIRRSSLPGRSRRRKHGIVPIDI